MKFIPISQQELARSNVKVRRVPLVWGTSQFRMLVPEDTHFNLINSQEVSSPASENSHIVSPQFKPSESQFLYKIKIPLPIIDSLCKKPTFVAILVDLTNQEKNSFKVFKNLKVNKQGFLILGPDGNTIIDPVQIFNWINTESDLQGRTIKMEVYNVETQNQPVLLRFIHIGKFTPVTYQRAYLEVAKNFCEIFEKDTEKNNFSKALA